MPYLYNSWYVAAWSEEIDDSLFARTLLDIPVVIFRDAEGKPVAMHDMCPHRFAPLSMGTLVDNHIRCGYHGLEFDFAGNCTGSCIKTVTAPKAARVRTFPVFEQDAMVWIWLGDASPSDTAGIPRFLHHTDPEMICNFGLTRAQSDYRLLSDNLMDLTHTAVLHPAFGGLDYNPKVKCWEEGNEVISQFVIEDMPSFIEPGSGKIVHHTDEIRWYPAGIHALNSTTLMDGTNESMFTPSAHILTPESETTTHYFWSSANRADQSLGKDVMHKTLVQAFDFEDKPMVEAVQNRMNGRDFWDMKPLLLSTDAGGVRMRRKLNALIEVEQQQRSAAAKAG